MAAKQLSFLVLLIVSSCLFSSSHARESQFFSKYPSTTFSTNNDDAVLHTTKEPETTRNPYIIYTSNNDAVLHTTKEHETPSKPEIIYGTNNDAVLHTTKEPETTPQPERVYATNNDAVLHTTPKPETTSKPEIIYGTNNDAVLHTTKEPETTPQPDDNILVNEPAPTTHNRNNNNNNNLPDNDAQSDNKTPNYFHYNKTPIFHYNTEAENDNINESSSHEGYESQKPPMQGEQVQQFLNSVGT